MIHMLCSSANSWHAKHHLQQQVNTASPSSSFAVHLNLASNDHALPGALPPWRARPAQVAGFLQRRHFHLPGTAAQLLHEL
jgi:hypothetical protein